MYNPGQEISSIDFGSIIGGSLNAVVNAQSQSANTTVDFIKRVGFNTTFTKDEDGNRIESNTPINVDFTYDKVTAPAKVVTRQTYSVTKAEGGEGYLDADYKNYSLMAGEDELPVKGIELNGGTVNSITLGEVSDAVILPDGMALTLIYNGTEEQPTKPAELTLKVEKQVTNVPAVVQKMQLQVPILTMMPIPFIKIAHADIDFNVKINSVSSTSSKSDTNVKADASFKSSFFARTSLSASFSNQKSSSSSEEVKKDYSLNISIHAVQDDMPAGVSRILDILEESVTATPMLSDTTAA